jgi:hypothetical protein
MLSPFYFSLKGMSRKIQGAKRQEVIEKWLSGEDDPDWEITQTKTPGKYIIRPRKVKEQEKEEKKKSREEPKGSDDEHPEESDENEEDEPPPKKAPKPAEPVPEKKKPKLPKVYPGAAHKPVFSDDYAVEILNELRSIGELKRSKVAKRQQKKLIRHEVRKHVPKAQHPPPPAKEEYDYSDSSDYDFEIPPEPPALPQRSRVQLLR